MKHRLCIEYDIVTQEVAIVENDMTTFEAFGVMEAAKIMIGDRWLQLTDEPNSRPYPVVGRPFTCPFAGDLPGIVRDRAIAG